MRHAFFIHRKPRRAHRIICEAVKGFTWAQFIGHFTLTELQGCGNDDGILGDAVDVETGAEWPGPDGVYVRALLDCGGEGQAGLIEPIPDDPTRYRLHQFHEHCPEYVNARQRNRKLRELKKAEALRTDTSSLRNRAVVEKRSVAKSDNTPAAQECSTPAAPSLLPAPAVVMRFEIVGGKNGKPGVWELDQSFVDLLTSAFPGVDVLAECRKAHAWLTTNPTKRKTKKGMPDYLRRWMTRVQDVGGRNGANHADRQHPKRNGDFQRERPPLPILAGSADA